MYLVFIIVKLNRSFCSNSHPVHNQNTVLKLFVVYRYSDLINTKKSTATGESKFGVHAIGKPRAHAASFLFLVVIRTACNNLGRKGN